MPRRRRPGMSVEKVRDEIFTMEGDVSIVNMACQVLFVSLVNRGGGAMVLNIARSAAGGEKWAVGGFAFGGVGVGKKSGHADGRAPTVADAHHDLKEIAVGGGVGGDVDEKFREDATLAGSRSGRRRDGRGDWRFFGRRGGRRGRKRVPRRGHVYTDNSVSLACQGEPVYEWRKSCVRINSAIGQQQRAQGCPC